MFLKIVKLCKEKGITVTGLEKTLGFGRCTIVKWKESSPSVDTLKNVADYFGVSIEYFLQEDVSEKRGGIADGMAIAKESAAKNIEQITQ